MSETALNPADPLLASFSAQDALVAIMVGASASDENMTTNELLSIARMVDTLPVFGGYDRDRLRTVSQTVFDLLTEEDGLDALFGLVRDALPEELYDTAYALACDVAAADGHAFQAELQFLLEVRHELRIDRLHAAAIEKGSAARHRRLPTELPGAG
ncbi:tellurite resistance TerB family protein [Amaricoccus sp.]|uniref:tellurite resistance TerB family protein n=1 Tax=Amaricoccus sp. TaxID=1872485 RepID=UPI001B4F8825|nr:tellurite resistance TerB family protein [Amaricoccus sp.]MBP7001831.1 tellurite resistance TerB family protein [Amaricoccus sp.]